MFRKIQDLRRVHSRHSWYALPLPSFPRDLKMLFCEGRTQRLTFLTPPPSLHIRTCVFLAPFVLLTHPHTDSEPSPVDVPHISDTQRPKTGCLKGLSQGKAQEKGWGSRAESERFPSFSSQECHEIPEGWYPMRCL